MYAYLAAALISAALAFGGAWKVQDWRYGSREAARLAGVERANKIIERQGDGAAVGLETDRTKIHTVFQTIYKDVDHVVEKPVYLNECFDADGLRLITTATRADPAASEPTPAVSGPAAPQ